jgi:hypothetical protein
MAAQAQISAAKLKRKVGSIVDALVDHVDADGAVARTRADAPEIDGVLRIRDGQKPQARAVREGASPRPKITTGWCAGGVNAMPARYAPRCRRRTDRREAIESEHADALCRPATRRS